MRQSEMVEYFLLKSVEEVDRTSAEIGRITATKQNKATQRGFVTEEMHALTFNLMANSEYAIAEAFTDRQECFEYLGFKKNGRSDVVVSDGNQTDSSQLKFCKTPTRTYNALGEIRDGKHHYAELQLTAPADQIDGIRQKANNVSARQDVPELVKQTANYIGDNASDMVFFAGICSNPLSLAVANKITQCPQGPAFQEQVAPFLEWQVHSLLRHRLAEGHPNPIALFSSESPTATSIERPPEQASWAHNYCLERAQHHYQALLAEHAEENEPAHDLDLLF